MHLSVGELLRNCGKGEAAATIDPLIVADVEACIAGGRIVPVSVSLSLVKSSMSTHPPGTLFLLDGFPRNEDNVQGWSEGMGETSDVLGVVVFEVGKEVLRERVMSRGESSGRSDDNFEALEKR